MSKHAVFTFGRMNPPTTGHKKLVDKVVQHAHEHGAEHYVFPSHTQEAKKNPLHHEQKVSFLRKFFPKANVVSHPDVKTPIDAMKHLAAKGHKEVTMVVGSDRVDEFHKLLHKQNGKDYHFHKINVVSAGHRDPDAEGAEGMSASKMRDHAKNNNFSEFSKGVPNKSHAKSLFHAVRKGMHVENHVPNFKALFLVGGPGSGKDFLIHSVLGESNLKEVSLEKLFKSILEQTDMQELNDFPSIIVNGNADNKDKIIVAKAILESMGYDTAMIYVHTSEEESKKRNDLRIMKGAKTFNESVRLRKYNNSVTNMHAYVDMFEGFVLYDNSNNILSVNEDKKKEIANWLIELSETVDGFLVKKPSNSAALKWMNERVLEVGTKSTADFIRALTPGQEKSNVVRTYSEADRAIKKATCKSCTGKCSCGDVSGGTAVAGFNSAERTIAEIKVIKKQSIPPGDYGNTKSVALGSTGVASLPIGSPIYNEDKPVTKKKKFQTTPGLAMQGDVANFGNPSAASITTYRAESTLVRDFTKKLKGN